MYCLDTCIIRHLFDKIDSPETTNDKDLKNYMKQNLHEKRVRSIIDISKLYVYRDCAIRGLLLAKMEKLELENFCLTHFAHAEILTWFKHNLNVGIKAKSYERCESIKSNAQKFVNSLDVLEFNAKTVKIYAEIKSYLKKSGKDFDKHNDIWMAASCIQHNCTLITADEKDIGNKINGFKGFKYENWTKTD